VKNKCKVNWQLLIGSWVVLSSLPFEHGKMQQEKAKFEHVQPCPFHHLH